MTAAGVAFNMSEATPATRRITLSAEDSFEQGMGGANVQRDPVTGGIGLYDRHLIEDDGPGAGDHQPGKNAAPPLFDRLNSTTIVPSPRARGG